MVHTWRPSWPTRLVGAGAVAAFWLVGILLTTNPAEAADRITGVVFIVVAPLAAWLFTWRPQLSITGSEVLVQNALRAYAIPLIAVRRAAPGGYGVMLDVQGRRLPIVAMAVVKANISVMRKRQVRADAVAHIIGNAAELARTGRTAE